MAILIFCGGLISLWKDLRQQVFAAEGAGLPLFDHAVVMPLERHEERQADALRLLAQAPPGLTYVIFHPSTDSPELRAFAPDWRARVADYHLFISDTLRQLLAEAGVQVIGFRALRDVMRNE